MPRNGYPVSGPRCQLRPLIGAMKDNAGRHAGRQQTFLVFYRSETELMFLSGKPLSMCCQVAPESELRNAPSREARRI